MRKKFVKYELDTDHLPPLTQQQKAELESLEALPDSEIDYSDIPPLTDDFWKNAVAQSILPACQDIHYGAFGY